MRFRAFAIAILMLILCGNAFAGESPDPGPEEVTVDRIRDFLETEKRYEGSITLDEELQNRHKEDAGRIAELFYSREYQGSIQAEVERLKATLFKKPLDEYYREGRNHDEATSGFPDTERLYIFVSSSVPLQTLRNYAAALDRIGNPHIKMVMIGFVGGMKYIKPTLEFVSKVIAKDENCAGGIEKCEVYSVNIEIDPLLFRRYGITRVPAFVYVPQIEIRDPGMSEGMNGNAEVGRYYLVSGDASLDYVLEYLHRHTGSDSIENLLAALRKGFYQEAN